VFTSLPAARAPCAAAHRRRRAAGLVRVRRGVRERRRKNRRAGRGARTAEPVEAAAAAEALHCLDQTLLVLPVAAKE